MKCLRFAAVLVAALVATTDPARTRTLRRAPYE